MELIISSVLTAIINLLVFSSIPLIWWFCRYRKKERFFKWIGIYKPQLKSKWWLLLIFAVLYYFFYDFDFTQLVDANTLAYIENSSSVSVNAFAGIGVAAILPALIENFIANGVAEEILYRGFLCKRFCNKLSDVQGILLQALLFGLMHNVIYLLAGLNVGIWYHTLIFLFTGTGALLLGWLNEKLWKKSLTKANICAIITHRTNVRLLNPYEV